MLNASALPLVIFILGLPKYIEETPAAALQRFPNFQETQWAVQINLKWKRWLELQASLYPWKGCYWDLIEDAEARCLLWDALSDFHLWVSDYRRDRFRELLGQPNYSLGRLPPPVPWHCVPEID